MISFRFHLVSLSAVFFALALGVVFGFTFLSESTVNSLESRIDSVRADVREARAELSTLRKFGDQAEESLIVGRLEGIRVLTIVPDGLDGAVVDKMHSVLSTAGAVDAGTLTLDKAWGGDAARTDEIADILGIVGPISADAVVAEAAARLAQEFAVGGGVTLPALAEAGLIRLEGDPATTPGEGARVVVIDAGPPVGLLDPLTRALAAQAPNRVLVADAGPEDEVRESLVGLLRRDAEGLRLSTVDHIRTPQGRIAAVLALRDFDRNAVGDYGSDASADRAAPAQG